MRAAEHADARDKLVDTIHDVLSADARFVAAWLAGSLGRGDGDAWSDVDLWLAVADSACPALCNRPDGFAATLSPGRGELVARFGDVAVEGENAVNAGPDGVAMNIVYRDPVVVVDWYLVPATSARRPTDTRLLFDHSGIPIAEATRVPAHDRARLAAVEVAMFWYFTQTTVKAIRRGDVVQAQLLFQHMRACAWRAERLVNGLPAGHYRERGQGLARSPSEQIELLRQACSHMLTVMPRVEAIGGAVPRDPMSWVEALLV